LAIDCYPPNELLKDYNTQLQALSPEMSSPSRRWGNGPAEPTSGIWSGVKESSLRVMVFKQRSPGDRLQASSRDDHGPLCRNRRVFGICERVRDGREWQDRAGRQGVERA